jgi:hypothetical protein
MLKLLAGLLGCLPIYGLNNVHIINLNTVQEQKNPEVCEVGLLRTS